MAEHDSDRERREDRDDREPEEQHVPFDEDAAWAAIVAGYGEEPPDPPGAKPFKSVEDLALPESGTNDEASGGPDRKPTADKGKKDPKDQKDQKDDEPAKPEEPEADKPVKPVGSSVSFAPGVGPRDYSLPEPSEDDFDTDDEGHFVPPEPPPLPAADATAKFAWLAVIGGPILLLLAVVLGWDMTWWLATLGIGGFVGGFATLVMRMKTDDDEDDDPGRGAVV
ncbi:hypothetical protein J7F01_07755 [Streptomyces sp. ISL-22]|uniref:DUF308 domain-containing protein n=1 Tax=Streptomyces curacoi TaxID=146536 RepID=A0A117PM31_9ACTN|nr:MULTISPECIES: hypothetical protein [Streptomyces]KUM82124.1 hypothetical protein AQI70_02110 [Streptomyces curacoi]MBT2422927.1 hypothetical protein [Streptomyces sp. ISL-24]MBT2432094.1 hypothetical protein [Streptomyces sp. ISL-22]